GTIGKRQRTGAVQDAIAPIVALAGSRSSRGPACVVDAFPCRATVPPGGTDGMTTIATGVFFSPSGGVVANDQIAVFTFDWISIGADVTVNGARNAHSRPIALLSHGDITNAGIINVSAANGADKTGINGL